MTGANYSLRSDNYPCAKYIIAYKVIGRLRNKMTKTDLSNNKSYQKSRKQD